MYRISYLIDKNFMNRRLLQTLFTLIFGIISLSATAQIIPSENLEDEGYGHSTCMDSTCQDFQNAIMFAKELIYETDSQNLNHFHTLAVDYFKASYYDSAIMVYDYILSRDSCYKHAFFDRGVCKYFLSDLDGACEDWNHALVCHGDEIPDLEDHYLPLCIKEEPTE